RSWLAINRVLAGAGPGGLYVFDEVDSGVGGGIAEVIGQKIHQVAAYHQVLCITHQAQIAAFADDHFFVSKQVDEGRTSSHIRALDLSSRADELARMMGGVTIDGATRMAARELLQRTQGGRL
ncbi:MAG: DNA repair protein RecN (Recombination protein N), partial [Kiritimatiellia bacterium]